jgi:hypothetical protein
MITPTIVEDGNGSRIFIKNRSQIRCNAFLTVVSIYEGNKRRAVQGHRDAFTLRRDVLQPCLSSLLGEVVKRCPC